MRSLNWRKEPERQATTTVLDTTRHDRVAVAGGSVKHALELSYQTLSPCADISRGVQAKREE